MRQDAAELEMFHLANIELELNARFGTSIQYLE